jgi:hypothetical protein
MSLSSGARLRLLQSTSGKQPGDPAKAAKAILIAVNSEHPPLRLLLGKVALDAVRDKFETVEEEFSKWEDISLGIRLKKILGYEYQGQSKY